LVVATIACGCSERAAHASCAPYAGPDLAEPRVGHAVVVDSRDRVVVIGGLDRLGGHLSSVEVLSHGGTHLQRGPRLPRGAQPRGRGGVRWWGGGGRRAGSPWRGLERVAVGRRVVGLGADDA